MQKIEPGNRACSIFSQPAWVGVAVRVLYCSAVQSESILSRQSTAADLRFSYGEDANQFVDVRLPQGDGPHPIVFFIHGGYWRARYDLVHAGHLCEALRKAGIATWNVEYRRVGNPGGGWPGTLDDIRSAYRLLPAGQQGCNAKLDLQRLCVAGHSAGGHLALCLAAYESSVARVVSLAGVLDLHRAWELHLSNDAVVEFLGGTPATVPDRYQAASPAAWAIPRAVQKIIHGTKDDSVPYEIGRSYVEHKKQSGEDVELISFPESGHFELVDPGSRVWKQVEQVFTSLLREG